MYGSAPTPGTPGYYSALTLKGSDRPGLRLKLLTLGVGDNLLYPFTAVPLRKKTKVQMRLEERSQMESRTIVCYLGGIWRRLEPL